MIAQDPRLGQMVAAKVVKQQIAAAPDGAKNFELTTAGPSTLKVPIPISHRNVTAKYPDSPIPAEEIKKLMIVNKMSFRAIERDAQFYRAMKGRDFYQPGALDILKTELETMKPFFILKWYIFDCKNKKDGQARLPIVYCKNLPAMIEYLKDCRGFHPNTKCMIKLGGDEGQKILKISINLIKEPDDLASPVQKKTFSYANGPFSTRFKGSGVNLTIIVAAVPYVSESYHNLKIIWDLLKLKTLSYNPALDMKFALTALGLGTGASTCPCPFCICKKDDFLKYLFEGGELRTFKSISENARAYQRAKAAYTGKQHFSSAPWFNCENEPLLMPVGTSPSATVLSVLPPMELHLNLGIVNRLWDELDKRLRENNCSMTAKDWSDALNCFRSEYHGGTFQGEQCVKLLNNTAALRELLILNGAMHIGGQIVKVLEAFNDVRKSCFGQTCDPKFKEYIAVFAYAYVDLKISITPKVHCVIVHIPQFLALHPGKGLGFFSEQATEHLHSDLETFYSKCKYRRNLSDPEFPQSFSKMIIAYDSCHEGDETAD